MTNKCSIDGCEKYAITNKLCVGHGGKRKRCKISICDSQCVRNGLCIIHRKNSEIKICPICNREIKPTKSITRDHWAHDKCLSRISMKEHRKKILKETQNMLLDDYPILIFEL